MIESYLGNHDPALTATVFNTMRILKRLNPGDTYLENYLGHLKRNPDFYDLYCLIWQIVAERHPKRILEIGTRTGISLCQMLSAYVDYSIIEKVICIDPFDSFTSPKIVEMNLKYLNIPVQPTFIVGKSQDELPKLIEKGEKFDYILVDGDHSREVAASDLDMVHSLIDTNGLIVMDDISPNPGECNLIGVFNTFMAKHMSHYRYSCFDETAKGCAWAERK